MKPTTLIHYLRNKNRIISVLNELYGTEIPDTADVQYNECAFSGVPGYQSMLCCTIKNKVIIVSEEKFRVDRYNLVQMMKMFQNALFQMSEENLAQADVYYIILDTSASVTLEPDIEMNGVAPGHSIMSLACNHADVFDMTYDEENMPYALKKSKTLRDYAAWSLAGHSILQRGGIRYAMYESLSSWVAIEAREDNSFSPYAFAEEHNIMSEAFDEWELEVFIQNARNEAYENGCEETHRCADEYRKENWPARLKIYPSVGDVYYVELPDSYKGAEWDQIEKWVDEHLNTKLVEEIKPDEP